MTDITSSTVIYTQETGVSQEANGAFPCITLVAETSKAVVGTDTFTVNLAQYGITNFMYIRGFRHTTKGDVLVVEQPTTSVSAGVLTVTTITGNNNQVRSYLIGGV